VKIALVCPYAWDAPGGVQVHVRALQDRLPSLGHRTVVLAPALEASTRGVEVIGRAVRVRYQGTVAPICISVRSLRRIRRALARFSPDVVHVHEPLAPSTSMLATRAARAPVVATFHAHTERSALFDAAAPVLRPVWRRLARRIAVSETAASFVRSRMGNGIRVIPNGVEVDRFASARPADDLPPGRRILWVGRLDPQKGFPVAVGAFARLAPEHPDVWLVVAGEGRDREAAGRLPPEIRRRVVLLGAVPHERLPALHAGADVFIAPALGQESFGMVLVEAMAAGVPVVASDIGGYRDVIRDGVTGVLVPAGDAGVLAAAIGGLLADPDGARALAEKGRQEAQRYAWDRVVEDIAAVYEEVAKS
jgi:phosphatidylinositol alpha-mannosyltransferase